MQLTNLVKSPPDSRDYQYASTAAPLPRKVDLRQFVPDIEDQQSEGSCTCNSTTSALELLTNRAGKWEDLSRQFPYYVVREYENRIGQDGAALRDVFKVGSKTGFCLESEWPYLADNENVKPSDVAYASAATRLITLYESVPLAVGLNSTVGYWEAINNLKSALAEGLPVVIALSVNQTIFDLKGPVAQQNYSLRDPATSQLYPSVGNHAVALVGYDDDGGYFIFQNSWGASWGDGGFGAIKYGVIGGCIFEAWVVRGFNGIEIAKPAPVQVPVPPTPEPTPPAPPQPDPAPVPPSPPEPPKPEPAPPQPTPQPEKSDNTPVLIATALIAIAIATKIFGLW